MDVFLKFAWMIATLTLGIVGYSTQTPDYSFSYLDAFLMSIFGVVMTPIALLFHGEIPNIWFVLQFCMYLLPLAYFYYESHMSKRNHSD